MEQDEQPRQELVKCVLVGDNAVGKTRLTCARATRQHCSLSQLLNPHVPTVWAIDQYRIYKEVLQNSWTVVDGIKVSLRLWDTFGDHHKDRRFAYGRSDVVLMCFDIGRKSSLENCREMWYHQIKRFCPHTPIILVGCKNDVRFMYQDSEYLNYCRDRSPLVRQVRENDIVMPEKARAVARELGLPYYETSVLTYYGIDEVFENAIRAALCARRNQRFWVTGLKKVMQPALQEPFCPPKQDLPTVSIQKSCYSDDLSTMSQDQYFTDVIFLCGNVGFSAHRFLLAASSPLLMKIFTTDFSQQEQSSTRSNSETSLLSLSHAGSNTLYLDFFNVDDTEYLLPGSESSSPARGTGRRYMCASDTSPGNSSSDDQRSYRDSPRDLCRTWVRNLRPSNTSGQHLMKCFVEKERLDCRIQRASSVNGWNCASGLSVSSSSPSRIPRHAIPQIFAYEPKPGVFRNLNYPAFHSIRIEQIQSLDGQGQIINSVQTVLSCSKLIQPQAMNQIIKYLYGKEIDQKLCSIVDLKQAAEFMDVPDLYHFLAQEISKPSNYGPEILTVHGVSDNDKDEGDKNDRQIQMRGLSEVCLLDCLFSDIVFRLDDGTASAHKPLLMARCDMMRAMFSHNDFKEKSARVVHFPGVSALAFHQLLHYIYTDGTPPKITTSNCVELIALANRLWLPRLVTLVEAEVVKQMSSKLSLTSQKKQSPPTKSAESMNIVNDSMSDLPEEALSILQPCQMHNANQLANWCLSYLSLNYNHVCRKYPKILRLLNVNRWPPIWYLKDHDNYQRMAAEREREETPKNFRKRARRNSGCLCFSSSSSSGMGSGNGGIKSRRDDDAYERNTSD